MVIRELATGSETRVDDVQSVDFNDDGSWLVYTVSSRGTPANDGVYLRSLADGRVLPVLTGVGNYRQVTFDRAGQQLAFVSDRDEYAAQAKPRFTLYHAGNGDWMLGWRRCAPISLVCGVVQPVAGPLRPPSSGGLRIRALTAPNRWEIEARGAGSEHAVRATVPRRGGKASRCRWCCWCCSRSGCCRRSR